VAATLLLGACGTTSGLYDWGGYDTVLHQSHQQPDRAADSMHKLEAHVAAVEQRHGKVAPGLYAELGTMFLKAGNREQALANYRKEKAAWPESATLMQALIAGLETARPDKS
jgi:hypothetical protein